MIYTPFNCNTSGLTNECNVITLLQLSPSCQINLYPTNETSVDGSLSILVSGGSSPYTIVWQNGVIESSNTGSTLNNLSAGTYSATIIDNWGDFTATTSCILIPATTTTTSTTTTTTLPPYDLYFCLALRNTETSFNDLVINFAYNGLINGQPSWISVNVNFIPNTSYTITGDTLGTEWRVNGFTGPNYVFTNSEPSTGSWIAVGFPGPPLDVIIYQDECQQIVLP